MTDPSPLIPNPAPRHDTSRVHVAGVFWFILAFILSLFTLFAVVWIFQYRLHAFGPEESPQSQITPLPQPLQPSPDHPQLPWQDMANLRAAQEAQLNSAGDLPHDPAHRHIPINQAIDNLLNSGALTQPWQNPTTFPYLRPPTEPALPSVENRT